LSQLIGKLNEKKDGEDNREDISRVQELDVEITYLEKDLRRLFEQTDGYRSEAVKNIIQHKDDVMKNLARVDFTEENQNDNEENKTEDSDSEKSDHSEKSEEESDNSANEESNNGSE